MRYLDSGGVGEGDLHWPFKPSHLQATYQNVQMETGYQRVQSSSLSSGTAHTF